MITAAKAKTGLRNIDFQFTNANMLIIEMAVKNTIYQIIIFHHCQLQTVYIK